MNAREHAVRLAVLKALSEEVKRVDIEARKAAKDEFVAGDRITATLEDGTVVGSVTRTKLEPESVAWAVVDPQAFLAWCKANRPTAVVENVRSSDQQAILADLESGKVTEVPDGVDAIDVPAKGGTLQVRPDYAAVMALDWRPYVGQQIAAPEAPAIEDEHWVVPAGYCPAFTEWHGPGSDRDHIHRCTKEDHRPNERHECACGASWLTKEVE